MTECNEFSFLLKSSGEKGVGVFATHAITKGSPLFPREIKLRTLPVADIPAPFRKLCIYINEHECICPERFDHIEVAWFINHSLSSNCHHKNNDVHLFASRDIHAGEEILLDYNDLNEPEHLKEDYYKR